MEVVAGILLWLAIAVAIAVHHYRVIPPADRWWNAPVYDPPRRRTPLPQRPPVRHWCPECDCTDHTVMVWTTFNRYICRECMDNGGYAHQGSVAWKREQIIKTT